MIRIRSRGRTTVISAVVLGLCIAGVSGITAAIPASAAATINVPGDQPTIQAAINAASDGDTISVAPGTYLQNIDFLGKAVTVESTGGPTVTTIDGSNTGCVVLMNKNEGAGSVLHGFTVQHSGISCAGVGAYGSSPTISGNIITNNTSQNTVGIEASGGSPTITGNLVTSNVGCNGGGIDVAFSGALIQDNFITNNSLNCVGGNVGGAGIRVIGAGSAQIIGNTITGNTANGSLGGGIALFGAGSPVIRNNIISNNQAREGGGIGYDEGGISEGDTNATIVQNAVTGNTATVLGGTAVAGGGMFFNIAAPSSGVVLVNNTIAANTTTSGGRGVSFVGAYAASSLYNNIVTDGIDCDSGTSAAPSFTSNNVSSYSGNCAGTTGTNGNISVDPLLAGPTTGDVHLRSGSPSIDAGSNTAPSLPATDLLGDTRVVGASVDQGVYEVQPPSTDPTGEFTPLTPARIVDTRDGTGGRLGTLGPASQFDVQITGQGGVPNTGVSAVVLNATVTGTTAASYLTVWPTGAPRGPLSNLNYVPGQTVPNLVTVKVGTGGKVSVYNNAGATHVIFDVVGFYSDGSGPAGSRYHAVSPSRYFDTRVGSGGVPQHTIAAGQVLPFKVTGRNGVPATGVTSVVMNVTVTEPTSSGYVTVYPSDVPRPNASSLNFVTGLTVPNLVTVRVPANGVVNFYNFSNFGGTIHLLADVVGYYDGDKSTDGGRFVPLDPQRSIDTRVDPPGPVPGGYALLLQMLGRNGVPFDGVGSVVANVTVTQPTASGYVTVFPADQPLPLASNLNYVPGQTVPNLVIAKLSSGPPPGGAQTPGWIAIFNYAGQSQIVVDVFGYFTASFSDVVGQGVPGGSPGPTALLVPMAQ